MYKEKRMCVRFGRVVTAIKKKKDKERIWVPERYQKHAFGYIIFKIFYPYVDTSVNYLTAL